MGRAPQLAHSTRLARATYLRPFGLHPEPNPLLKLACLGLNIYWAITFSTLHMIYEGIWKVLVECTFGQLQRSAASKAEFNKLGKRIDVWVTTAIAPTPFVKTSFTKGISRYLYGALTESTKPWESAVKFGKITSKDTWRDIMRFWRMLIFDLFPGALAMMTLFTDYFEWVRLVLLAAPTDANLVHAETYYEAWLAGGVALFGAVHFSKRIKAHAPAHIRKLISLHGSTPFNDDGLGESAHIEGAKEPWERTNHRDVNAQLATFVARRDTLRLLEQRMVQLRDTERHMPNAPSSAPPAHTAPAPPPQNKLMIPRPARTLELSLAAITHPQLSQLGFCLRLYLHLASGGSLHMHVRDMPEADTSTLRQRSGVHLAPQPAQVRVALGGHILKGNVLLDEHNLSMVAVKARVAGSGSYTVWYGQLVFCFEVQYLGKWQSLCLVRWLDVPKAVLQTKAAVARRQLSAAERSYLREMRTAPFAAYRWSCATGSTRTGHPDYVLFLPQHIRHALYSIHTSSFT